MTHLEKEYVLVKINTNNGHREEVGRRFESKHEYKKFINEQTDEDNMYSVRWQVNKTYIKRWDR